MSEGSATQTPWGPRRQALISVEEAWADIVSQVAAGDVEEVALAEAAGRVLARPVNCQIDCPPFDKAMMDGFAVRSADCQSPAVELRVRGLAAAGGTAVGGVAAGEAVRINTGAPMPPGADAVVQIEKTTNVDVGERVRIEASVSPRTNVELRGAVRRTGELVVVRGSRIGAGQLAALATAGAARVSVYRRPEVAILVTGDELASPGAARAEGQIFESNGVMLAAQVAGWGGLPREPVVVPDDERVLRERLQAALTAQVVLLAGGMSMGTLDLVPKAMEKLGVVIRWHGVNMRPGKPAAYGRGPAGQHVFGLPGNPVSAFVCAEIFARVAFEALHGLPPGPPKLWRAALAVDVKPAKDPRPAFVPGRVWSDEARGLVMEPCAWKGSSDPFGLVSANALWYRRESSQPVQANEPGCAIMLRQP